ncbi:hypothetical protein CAC42_3931 [Sphaceloma murrayae]|uniref:Uncharacterized protein n=1 Tax=Sphaceloma murrayae TaxID=2082308 RepID=A0A2K1QSE7_9PEZI|nr:hypothetical protein CAC42_3931 [Sphaceloma murrayae]
MDLTHDDIRMIFVNFVSVLVIAILNRTYPAEDHVIEYLEQLPSRSQPSIRAFAAWLSQSLDIDQLLFIIKGTANDFLWRQELPARARLIGLAGDKQGGYADVLLDLTVGSKWWLYVGSAYGNRGLRNRVYNQHDNKTFRAANFCYHYRLVEEGAQMNFLRTFLFIDPVPPAAVLVTESGVVNILGSLHNDFHLRHRDPRLPQISRLHTVNRDDPVITNDMFSMQRAMALEARKVLMRKGLDGGIFDVHRRNSTVGKHDWRLKISGLEIYVSMGVVEALDLGQCTPVDLKFTLSEARPNPLKWADLAIEYDDGYKLCIEISRMVNGVRMSGYLTKAHPSAVAQANALHDWLLGELSDVDSMTPEDWGWDRYPFFGPLKDRVSKQTWATVFKNPRRRQYLYEHETPEQVEWIYLTPGELDEEDLASGDLVRLRYERRDQSRAGPLTPDQMFDYLLSLDAGAQRRWGGETVRIANPAAPWTL